MPPTKPPGTTAHQEEPRALGGKLPRLIGEALAHDRAFLDALEQQRPHTFEGNVTAIQRDNTGVNRVQVQRTGQPRSDATWYTVWGTFYVPDIGDQVRLLVIGKGAAVLLGAKHGGRPHQWTIPYSGGSLHQRNASGGLIHKHGDDHHHRHYQTDGTTLAHHHSATGQHAHQGDHVMGGGGGLVIGDTGTPSGTYHKKTHNAGRYEHYQGSTLVRHHTASGDHGHYSSGTLIHNIVTVGTAGGAVKTRQHNTSNYHQHGDDGSGKLYMKHAGGNRAYDHDGTSIQHYSGGQVAHATNGNAHGFYDLSQSSTNAVAYLTSRQTLEGAGGSGGALSVKQGGTTNYHSTTDEGGILRHRSVNDGMYHDVNAGSGTASRHTHDSSTHTFPTGAKHTTPSGSWIDTLGSGGAAAVRRTSLSYTHTTQSVGGITLTGDANTASVNSNAQGFGWNDWTISGLDADAIFHQPVWPVIYATSTPPAHRHHPGHAYGTHTEAGHTQPNTLQGWGGPVWDGGSSAWRADIAAHHTTGHEHTGGGRVTHRSTAGGWGTGGGVSALFNLHYHNT